MNAPSPSPLLRPVLIAFGLFFIFGLAVMNRLWPSGWAWQPEQPAYLHMILGINPEAGWARFFWPAGDRGRYLAAPPARS